MKILSGHWAAGSSGPVPRSARVLGIKLPDSWSIEVWAGSGCRQWGKQVGEHWALGTWKKLVEDETPPAGLYVSAGLSVILELRSAGLPNTICRNN